MFSFIDTQIKSLVLHLVGNKIADGEIKLSEEELHINESLLQLLTHYFVSAFKSGARYEFSHDSDLSMNEVYSYVSAIFDDGSNLLEKSKLIAKHLFSHSTHPKVKKGELYVVYFKNCTIDDEQVDAIGIFKSENKDTFLKIYPKGNSFEIEKEKGININRLDKGCLIFNKHRSTGYIVSIVDTINVGGDAKYWVENFLQVKRKNDSYTQTQNAMAMCKGFISQLPSDIDKADKAAMMNRVVDSLKQESVNMDSVAERAFGPDHSASFNSFRNEYQETHEVSFDDSFQGKPEAIKRRATGTMTTIKLDKNFDVNIHGGEQFIERGYDEEMGMRYYKLYFNEEK